MKKYKYISFDIFDTLLRRLVFHPHQVFDLIESCAKSRGYFIPRDFRSVRVSAEREAGKYADIYDIYERIKEFPSVESREIIIKLELEAEISICVPNPEIVSLFRKCVNEDKYVILISDMYLPAFFIEKILEKCGISGYKKIYVSCECKAEKCDGEIFSKVLKDLKIKPHELLHIGDNKKSDFLMPGFYGISSRLYKPCKNIIPKNGNEVIKNQQAFINGMMNLKSDEKRKSESFSFGYSKFGTMLFGFVEWLEKCFDEDNIDKVFFLSRDGNIMQKAYEEIGGKHYHRYIYVSRRALIVPLICKHLDLRDAIDLFFYEKTETVESLLFKLGLVALKYEDKIKEFGLSLDENINMNNICESRFAKLYESIKNDIKHNSEEQLRLIGNYLRSLDFEGNVAIVDIGWFGHMQKAVVDIANECGLNASVKGYYLGVNPSSKTVEIHSLNTRGYLFEKNNSKLFLYEKTINAVMEYIFSAFHGSVLGYTESLPLFDTYEYIDCNDEICILKEIQSAALEYIRDVYEHIFFRCQNFTNNECFYNMLQASKIVDSRIIRLFGDLKYKAGDMKMHYFAKPRNIFYYLFHFNQFRNELRRSGWKLGFIKRLVGFPLPYSRIYFFARKCLRKDSEK